MPEGSVKRKIPITIGADPEMFLQDKQTKKFVSAHDLLPGTKDKPFAVDSGAIQVDGVAAEFNITPALNSTSFLGNCTVVMDKIRQTVGDRFDLILQPTVTFDKEYWDTVPMSAKELGCNPDFNAWTGDRNPSPDGALTTMRTASGHIHIGWCKGRDPNDPDHFEDCRTLVKQLDYYLGAPSIIWDGNQDRRKLYGKAGAFRPKSYGVEYRVLSNRWLASSGLTKWVYNTAYTCVNNLLQGADVLEDKYGDLARKVIDESQKWWDGGEMLSLYHNSIGLELPMGHLDKVYQKEKKEEVKPTRVSPKKPRADWDYDSPQTTTQIALDQAMAGILATQTGTSTSSGF